MVKRTHRFFPVNKTPYPFQIVGAEFALQKDAAYIADEMGLGKTVQAIAVINTIKAFPKVLIVCPAVAKYTWVYELQKWLTYPLTSHVIEGTKECDLKKADVTIINFDILRHHKKKLQTTLYDLVVIDEVHYCGKHGSQRSKVVYGIPTRKKLWMSGTPIPNKVKNLWAQAYALDKSFGTYKEFTTKYCAGHFRGFGRWKKWHCEGSSNLEELQKKLGRIMIRRLTKEVLPDLPERLTKIVPIPSNEDSRNLSAELMDKAAEIMGLRNTKDVQKMNGLATVAQNLQAKYRKEAAKIKLPFAIKYVEDLLLTKQKVVVFAYHRDVTKAIYDHFAPNAVLVRGGVSSKDKKEAEKEFQTNPECRVFVGNLESAGTNITLTAADTEVFVEYDWVPGKVIQAAKRCHRIGQKNIVTIHLLVLNDSIDINMAKGIDRKLKDQSAALDGLSEDWVDLLFEGED